MSSDHAAAPPDHPSVAGRVAELRHLTDGVRRLIRHVNATVPPPEAARAAVVSLSALNRELEALIPEPVPARLHLGGPPPVPGTGAPYDVIHGPFNPIAVPLEIRVEPPEAVAEVVFDPTHEGPPGLVHGAVLIGSFDMVCSTANSVAGRVGPTASLRVSYERATRIGEPVEFRARQVAADGRRIHTAGEVRQGGVVTCRAAAVFIELDRARLARLARGQAS